MLHIEDNKWIKFSKKDNLVCCDCCLSHSLEFKVVNGTFYIKFKRDDVSTNKYRNGKNANKTLLNIVKEIL